MRLPFHGGLSVLIAPDAILRVIILVAVVSRKIPVIVNRVTRENKRAGECNRSAVDGGEAAGSDVSRAHAVEIVEGGLIGRGQLRVSGTMVDIRILNKGNDLLHPAMFLSLRIRGIPLNQAAGFGIAFVV